MRFCTDRRTDGPTDRKTDPGIKAPSRSLQNKLNLGDLNLKFHYYFFFETALKNILGLKQILGRKQILCLKFWV